MRIEYSEKFTGEVSAFSLFGHPLKQILIDLEVLCAVQLTCRQTNASSEFLAAIFLDMRKRTINYITLSLWSRLNQALHILF